MPKKKKSRGKKTAHPTLFVFKGVIRYYEAGSMLELHAQVTPEEWDEIVKDTVEYSVFLNCLKETACPRLDEPWTTDDEWFRLQLEVSISRIRNIDPLKLAQFNVDDIRRQFSDQILKGVDQVKALIKDLRTQQAKLNNISVSEI
jgi:hypothetical protein